VFINENIFYLFERVEKICCIFVKNTMMVYLQLNEDTQQAKAVLAMLKTMPFIEIVEEKQYPNEITLSAVNEAETKKLKRYKSVDDLMKDLKK
jgi:hypothetical protein